MSEHVAAIKSAIHVLCQMHLKLRDTKCHKAQPAAAFQLSFFPLIFMRCVCRL